MCAFWVELKSLKKNFIIIIANGIKAASVLPLAPHRQAGTRPGFRPDEM